MPSTVYRNHPAISRSQLTDLHRSPLHYWAKHVDPDRITAEKSSPALRFGTAVHMAVLEPALFMQTYAEGPMAARSTKAWKEAVAASNYTLLPPDEYRSIQAIVKSLGAHTSASNALFRSQGINEATFITKDRTGLAIKCRADRVTESGWVIDLKTTQDASTIAFMKSVYNFQYHIQAAFYLRCIEQATGVKPKGFVIIAVEKEPPFACQAFHCDGEMIAEGEKEVDALLNQLKILSETYGKEPWPSYSEEVTLLSLPEWAFK
jgi:acetolactate synthase regulatory subunit